MNYLALLCVALSGLLWPALPRAQQDTTAPLIVAAGERVAGDVATTTRSVLVVGEVLGDVTSLSGDIEVRGHVAGDVVSYSGVVVLGPGAAVGGNVLALTGSVKADALAVVGGRHFAPEPVAAMASLAELVAPDAAPAPQMTRAVLALPLLLLLLALCLLFPLIWPQRSAATLAMLRRYPWYSLGFGLLTGLLLALLLPTLAALLALTLVGLLLLVPLLLLLGLLYSYGLAVLAQQIGYAIGRPAALQASLRGTLLLVGVLALLTLAAPWLALGLFFVLASAGLGAAFLSRGGTLRL